MTRVVSTGMPRYDRLFAMTRRPRKENKVKKILYCGAGIKPFDFESMYTALGLKNFLGGYTEKYLRDLLDITKGLRDAQLDVKPHYHDEAVWRSCIDRHVSGGTRHRLLSHKDDIFRLESESDVVVTVESSVICEAIILGKPVILLNYTAEKLLADYDDFPLVEHAQTRDGLDRAIRKCLYDKAYLQELAARRTRFLEHYAAYSDGKSAARVVEAVLSARRAPADRKAGLQHVH
jgi:hypothetical protein